MSYLVIMFNDGRYALRCEFEEMLRECGDLFEVEQLPCVTNVS